MEQISCTIDVRSGSVAAADQTTKHRKRYMSLDEHPECEAQVETVEQDLAPSRLDGYTYDSFGTFANRNKLWILERLNFLKPT